MSMYEHIGGFDKLGLTRFIVSYSYVSWASSSSLPFARNIDNVVASFGLVSYLGSSLSIDVAETRAARSRFSSSLRSVAMA